jgi:hypothetical protein
MNEVRRTIQVLDEKLNNMGEKFGKDINNLEKCRSGRNKKFNKSNRIHSRKHQQ